MKDHLTLERHSLLQKGLRLFVIPLMSYVIPERKLREGIAKLSEAGTQAITKAGSTHAMESFYGREKEHKGLVKKIREYISHELISATKGTRNRLKIVEDALYEEIARHVERGEALRILTCGGGTCRSFMNVLDRFVGKAKQPRLLIANIDLDPTAIAAGKQIAKEKGYDDHFAWHERSVLDLGSVPGMQEVHIVEMIGLAEYLDDNTLTAVFAAIESVMARGGLFIVGNVRPTNEARFYKKIGWPHMYYRTQAQLVRLLSSAGFQPRNVVVVAEPVGLHNIAFVRL